MKGNSIMNVIKIKHIPKCVYVIMGILAVMCIGANFSVKMADEDEKSSLIYALVIGLLYIALFFLICFEKTTVKFGEGSIIKCRWLFLFWKIDLNNISAVTYTLKSVRARYGGTKYSFHMIFYVDKDNFKVLKEPLEQCIAEECIRRRFDMVKLMKLYQYIKNNCSDIAKGYE